VSLPPPYDPSGGQTPPPPPPGGYRPTPVGRVEPQRVTIRLPSTRPTVTYTILAVTVLVFIAQMASLYLLGNDYPEFWGAKINQFIIQGQFWRFLTPALLHADNNILHIGFNMYALVVIGVGLERSYGHARFFILYVLGAFAGNVASFWMSSGASVGASTAIFALVAAEGVFIYQNRALFGSRARSMLTNVLVIVAVNLFLGLSPGIDNWGHLGGLLGGLAFAWLAGPVLHVEGLAPDLHLADRRSVFAAWQIGAVEALVIAIIAAIKIFQSL
jgi:rhomboid protease GluP